MQTGIELIAEERQRQIDEEGWTAEHDDEHEGGELADAAAAYALGDDWFWPWSEGFKQYDYKHDLIRAGALIAAELDRLIRMEARNDGNEGNF